MAGRMPFSFGGAGGRGGDYRGPLLERRGVGRSQGQDPLTVAGTARGFLSLLSTTSSTASSCDTEFTKEDEQRLKDYIQQLRNDRAAVKLTMLELESIHIDPLSYDVKPRGDSQRLDLENAVLMQELMAMKVAWGWGPCAALSSRGDGRRPSDSRSAMMTSRPRLGSVTSCWRTARASFVGRTSFSVSGVPGAGHDPRGVSQLCSGTHHSPREARSDP